MSRKYLKNCCAVITLLTLSVSAAAEEVRDSVLRLLPDSIVISDKLRARLDSLSSPFDDPEISFEDISDNPLYYRLFMPLVLYGSAVSEAITPEANDRVEQDNLLPLEPLETGNERTLTKMIDEALVRIYLEHPELVEMTEAELMDVPGIIPISEDMVSGVRLKETRAGGRVLTDENSPERVRSKQRYWKTFGNFQGKYTQSYYSDNWRFKSSATVKRMALSRISFTSLHSFIMDSKAVSQSPLVAYLRIVPRYILGSSVVTSQPNTCSANKPATRSDSITSGNAIRMQLQLK